MAMIALEPGRSLGAPAGPLRGAIAGGSLGSSWVLGKDGPLEAHDPQKASTQPRTFLELKDRKIYICTSEFPKRGGHLIWTQNNSIPRIRIPKQDAHLMATAK